MMVHELCAGSGVEVLQLPPVCAKSLAWELVTVIAEMLSVVNSLLRKVKVCALLGVLIATLPKSRVAGASVASATPVPVSEEVRVLYGAGAFSFTVKVACSGAAALGVKVTVRMQELFAATLPAQVSVSVKSGLPRAAEKLSGVD
jgi:hypothetical protein